MFTATLINRAGTMALPFLILYLTQSMKFSPADAGKAMSAYGIGALAVSPLAGRLIDKIGSSAIMKFALLASGCVMLSYPFVSGYTTIVGTTFLWAILSEAFRPASLTAITEMIPAHQRKTAFVLNRLAINIGVSIGPVVGGFLVLVSYKLIFLIDGFTSILAGVFLVLTKWTVLSPSKRSENEPIQSEQPVGSVFRDWAYLSFLGSLILALVVFFQHNSTMPLFMVQILHMKPSVYGSLFLVNTIIIIALEVPLNDAMSHLPHRTTLMYGALLVAAGFGALQFAKDILGVALTIIIWTFGEMILLPTSSAYAAELSPERKRGVYMGFYQMTFSLALISSPLFGTWIFEHYGASVLYTGALGIGIISAIMFRGFGGTRPPQ